MEGAGKTESQYGTRLVFLVFFSHYNFNGNDTHMFNSWSLNLMFDSTQRTIFQCNYFHLDDVENHLIKMLIKRVFECVGCMQPVVNHQKSLNFITLIDP